MQPPSLPILHNFLLRHARERDKLSIEQVAAITGITPGEYQAIEEGRTLISQEDALVLARLFSIPVDYVVQSIYLLHHLYTYIRLTNKQEQLERYLSRQQNRNTISTTP